MDSDLSPSRRKSNRTIVQSQMSHTNFVAKALGVNGRVPQVVLRSPATHNVTVRSAVRSADRKNSAYSEPNVAPNGFIGTADDGNAYSSQISQNLSPVKEELLFTGGVDPETTAKATDYIDRMITNVDPMTSSDLLSKTILATCDNIIRSCDRETLRSDSRSRGSPATKKSQVIERFHTSSSFRYYTYTSLLFISVYLQFKNVHRNTCKCTSYSFIPVYILHLHPNFVHSFIHLHPKTVQHCICKFTLLSFTPISTPNSSI